MFQNFPNIYNYLLYGTIIVLLFVDTLPLLVSPTPFLSTKKSTTATTHASGLEIHIIVTSKTLPFLFLGSLPRNSRKNRLTISPQQSVIVLELSSGEESSAAVTVFCTKDRSDTIFSFYSCLLCLDCKIDTSAYIPQHETARFLLLSPILAAFLKPAKISVFTPLS